jgi:glutathione S-transferase
MTVLDLTGVEYDKEIIDPTKKEHKTKEYLAINPRGVIPCITYGGELMLESASIVRFIAGAFGLKDLYPENPVERHAVDSMMDFEATSVHETLQAAFTALRVKVAFFGGKIPTEQEKEAAMEQVHTALEKVVECLDTDFLAGDKFTIADIYMFF